LSRELVPSHISAGLADASRGIQLGLGIRFWGLGQGCWFGGFGCRGGRGRGSRRSGRAAHLTLFRFAAALLAEQSVQHLQDHLGPAFAAGASRFTSRFLAGFGFTGLGFAGLAGALFGQEFVQQFFPARRAASRLAGIAGLGFGHCAFDRFAGRRSAHIAAALLFEQFFQAGQEVMFGLAADITGLTSRFTCLGFWHGTFDRLPARFTAGATFQTP